MPRYILTVTAESGEAQKIERFMDSTKDLMDSHWSAQLDKSND